MNAIALRRYLRTGGWEAVARNLPAFLLTNPLPARRVDRGLTVVFDTDADGKLQASVDGILVVSEDRVHLTREDAQAKLGKERAGEGLSLRVDAELRTRLRRFSEATGQSASWTMRRGLVLYLNSRGF